MDGPCPECGTYHNPALTVDAVATRTKNGVQQVLLIRRGHEPWKGHWAFPGGFVDYGESPEEAVARELMEECGIEGMATDVVAVRGDPMRDPRGHVVTVFYRMEVDTSDEPVAGDDASHAEWVDIKSVELGMMGADHAEVVQLLLEQ